MMEDKPYTTQQHQAVIENIRRFTTSFGEPISPTREVWERRLKALEDTVTAGNCYWLVDLLKAEIGWHCGIRDTFGYGHDITLFDTLSWIHGAFRDRFLEQSKRVHDIIMDTIGTDIGYMKQRYLIKMPMRLANGQYVTVIRTSFPFQFDKDHNMVSHLNHAFVDLSSENQFAFEVTVFDPSGKREDLVKEVQYRTGALNPFTPRQLEIMVLYANQEVRNAKEVAKRLGLEIATVYTHQKAIRRIASEKTGIKSIPMSDLAKYYRDRLLI